MELQEDINELVEWANKWAMSFNVVVVLPQPVWPSRPTPH